MIVEDKTASGREERRLLIGTVVDPVVAAAVAQKWEGRGLFSSPLGNLIGRWAVDHFRKYRRPIADAVQAKFDQWAANGARDKDTVKLAEALLASLDGQYAREAKRSQSQFLVDLAGRYFSRVKLEQAMDEARAKLDAGEVDDAVRLLGGVRKVELGTGAGVDFFEDDDALERAFSVGTDPLVRYPGAAGNFFGNVLGRDRFVAFCGPAKRGKSYWLQDVAFRAWEQGLNVLVVQVGDLSEAQVLMRFYSRVARWPCEPDGLEVRLPLTIDHPADGHFADVVHAEPKVFPRVLSKRRAMQARDRMRAKFGGGVGKRLKVYTYSNFSITALGFAGLVDDLVRRGFCPDVVVLDYVDLLAPVDGKVESREQIDLTWKLLRKLSQDTHSLVVTATQTDTPSYAAEVITMANFSGSRTKNDHPDAVVGINQTDAEKERGVFRLNFPVRRNANWPVAKCLHSAGCLGIGNPCLLTTF